MKNTVKITYGVNHVKIILSQLDIRATSVGIILPDTFGTMETYEFFEELCSIEKEIRAIIVPVDQESPFYLPVIPSAVAFYIYKQQPMTDTIQYDMWVDIKKDEMIFTNNLPPVGDELIIASQMKTVVDTVTSESTKQDMLFSVKSLINRVDLPWWIELPEPVSDKVHYAASLLTVIKDNQSQIREVESIIKEKLHLGTFNYELIQKFDVTPSGIIATLQPGGIERNISLKSIRLQIGSAYFYFGVEQGILIDWVQLMIKQLEYFIVNPNLYNRGTV